MRVFNDRARRPSHDGSVYCCNEVRGECRFAFLIHPVCGVQCKKHIVGKGNALNPNYGSAEEKNKNNDCPDYMPKVAIEKLAEQNEKMLDFIRACQTAGPGGVELLRNDAKQLIAEIEKEDA
jgi:hypothetical protein